MIRALPHALPHALRLLIVTADPATAQPVIAALEGGQPMLGNLAWEVVVDAPERARLTAALAEQQTQMLAPASLRYCAAAAVR